MTTPKPESSGCCSDNCCGGTKKANAPSAAVADSVREKVREGYSKIAQSGSWSTAQAAVTAGCCGSTPASGGCCGPTTFSPEQLAAAIGYSQSELANAPDAANMGLSCGNPTAIASLKPGEVVLDLGAGGGFDCFIAGPKVGRTGRVIGVDMTPDMVSKARRNVASYQTQTGLDNVEFRLGEIEHLPVPNATVDVVISNCVLNLSPDKSQVWQEIARVLKSDGRVAVSDLALLRPLPESVRQDMEALVGCVAGAVLIDETRRQMEAAGLADIVLTPKAWVTLGISGGQGVRKFEGQVAFIAPLVDPTTRTAQVRIEVPVTELSLKPGMFAQVEIVSAPNGESPAPVVAVPDDAVQTVEGGPAVFVPVLNEPNTFAKRAVTIGNTVGGLVPIYSGLVEGESFVVAGTFILKAELGKGSAAHEH